tara:strand:+ start:1704 stop:2018 length:315 start_codon:yes stop_codon:yes gene_type:complete
MKAQERKGYPIYSGLVKYFPLALIEISRCSQVGNDQHHPDTELHWDREKSGDELDAMMRHLIDHSSGDIYDDDGVRHLCKVAWRALAALQKAVELDIEIKTIDE